MSTEKIDWPNRLAKWRMVFAGWQLGTRAKGDPEGDAVRDQREGQLLLRAEVTALVGLMMKKGVFTIDEYMEEYSDEARLLCEQLEKRFPGFTATDYGMEIDMRVAEAHGTTKGWKP